MKGKYPSRATEGEKAYVRHLGRASAFDLVDRGGAKILSSEDYPEPLKRFLAREQRMVHVRLSAAMKRKLEARSRKAGVPIDELARRWIEQAIERHAG